MCRAIQHQGTQQLVVLVVIVILTKMIQESGQHLCVPTAFLGLYNLLQSWEKEIMDINFKHDLIQQQDLQQIKYNGIGHRKNDFLTIHS